MSLSPAQIALAQIDCTVGDVAGNAARVRAAYAQAASLGAKLVLFPELTLCGYPPEDLVLRPAFRAACREAVAQLAPLTAQGPAMIVGGIDEAEGKIFNAAYLLADGKIAHIQRKVRLPNYGVFDEKRLFSEGVLPAPMVVEGTKIGLLICEDMWSDEVPRHLRAQGAEMFVVINASPYEETKHARRLRTAAGLGLPVVYVNLVGGQDDLVFDGSSFALDEKGEVTAQFPSFVEKNALANEKTALPGREASIYGALTLALHDYVRKNGFSGVLLGLSGGIDSALVAAIAVDALGAANVQGVLLPSPHTSRDSNEDALETARLLGIDTVTIPIAPAMEANEALLMSAFAQIKEERQNSEWKENLQARIRGNLLMAISNRTGRMLLNTGNKSELSVGYTTLYGDMCGGYAVLKDVYKTDVYQLARWRNEQARAIPARSITKAPTAELRPGQRDDDQLPPYEILDQVLLRLIEKRESVVEIITAGFDKAVVEKVEQLVRVNEYKRRQSPPGAKVTTMMFGRDRRFPLTNGFKG